MARVKVKVLRGNGLEQVVTVDTEATKGATLGTDVRLPSGAVATPATFLQWLGTTPGSSSGSGSSGGPSLSSILTTKGDLATRDTQVQRLGIGTQDQALRVSAAGMPEWRSGAALTKVDDTNVTLTLGGSPATSLLAAASLTLGWTGQLGETRGGTAQSSYLQGDMLYASALNTLGKLGIGASGRWLGSSGSAPQWNAPAALTKTDDTNVTLALGGTPTTALLNATSLTLGWTGQLAVSRGGTGKNALGTLSKTDDTNVTLTLGGTPANSLIESVSLTLGWTGQLGATRGGTAQSGYLTGDILYASALNTLSKLGIGSSGNVLTVAGGVPTWAAPTGGASGANPTASVGLTAVNGSASTFLRSDGAPALSQSIAPTWTGTHQFKGEARLTLTGDAGVTLGNHGAVATDIALVSFSTPAGGTNAKNAWFYTRGTTGAFHLAFVDDAISDTKDFYAATRSGYAVSAITYGNSTDNPAHTFYGQIQRNSAGSASAPDYSFAGDTNTGFYRSGADQLAIVTGGSARFTLDANGRALVLAPTSGNALAVAAVSNAFALYLSGGATTGQAYGIDVNAGTNSSDLCFRFRDNSSNNLLLLTGDGRLYGGALHNNSGAVTGTTNQYIASGTYTPTLTGVTNSASRTAYTMQWIRVGNVVTVSGMFDAAATAGAAQVKIGMTLPIASALTAQEQLGGGGASTGQGVASGNVAVAVYADATNDRAELRFLPPNTTVENYMVSFSYLVV